MAREWSNRFGLAQKGLFMLCKTQAGLQEEKHLAEEARRLGLSADVLTPEEAARLDPNIQMDIAGAVYYPQDCHLIPQRFLAGLTRALEEGGVRFVWSAGVTGWRVGEGCIEAVCTTQGEMQAEAYVLACGAWSSAVARLPGVRLLMQAGKGYSLTLPHPRQMPGIGSILTEARVAMTPMDSSLRFAGTMEITGLDLSINAARVRGILRAICAHFPAFRPEDFGDVPVWSGLRPCSPDGLPYVGRFRRYANLYAATGHAMMGLSLGPITGRLIAEILSEEEPSIEIGPLHPDRFA
jgi:D-amino-acid dehydrogenase